MGWKIAHTANSEIEILAEKILTDLVHNHAYDIAQDTLVPHELKQVKKIIEALQTADVMLVWREDKE